MRSYIGAESAEGSPNFVAISKLAANYVSNVDIFQLPCYLCCNAHLRRARPNSKPGEIHGGPGFRRSRRFDLDGRSAHLVARCESSCADPCDALRQRSL